jgi:acetyl-CoA acetyltransferase
LIIEKLFVATMPCTSGGTLRMRSASIVGIGATEFSKDSGRSELRLAIEAITAALDDAGLPRASVNGLATLTMDASRPGAVARALGLVDASFFAEVPGGGGGGCGVVGLAATAIAVGQADVVVCYRAMNERSQQRFGRPAAAGALGRAATSNEIDQSFTAPFGLSTPAALIGMSVRRYMHRYGATSEDFGHVSVSARAYAATNPAAWFYGRPITLEDHQNSRMIADPLRLLDCCQESDGGVALVLASTDRAADGPRLPVDVVAVTQALGSAPVSMASYARSDIAIPEETQQLGARLWRCSGWRPGDLDFAILYDHFGPTVLMQLEALGICDEGGAPEFVRSGQIRPGGSLPVNPNGGQLGEAYIHGFNGIAEAVRQIRGEAVNQVPGAQRAFVTSGSHVPTSGMLLASGDAR